MSNGTEPSPRDIRHIALLAYAAGVHDNAGKPWPPMDQASRDVAEAARAEYARYVAANAAALRAEGR